MQVRKQQLELEIEQQTGSRKEKEYLKAVYCLFNFYTDYIMRNAGLEESQGGNKIDGEISIISNMQMTPALWQKVKN